MYKFLILVVTLFQCATAIKVCEHQANIDFYGFDLPNGAKPGINPGVCCDLCKATPDCTLFTYYQGMCYLKKRERGSVPTAKAGAVSGNLVETMEDFQCPTIEKNLDYVDHDLKNVPGDYPEKCCKICKATPNCNAFTWSWFNAGTCWLKTIKIDTIASSGTYSAVMGTGCTVKQA